MSIPVAHFPPLGLDQGTLSCKKRRPLQHLKSKSGPLLADPHACVLAHAKQTHLGDIASITTAPWDTERSNTKTQQPQQITLRNPVDNNGHINSLKEICAQGSERHGPRWFGDSCRVPACKMFSVEESYKTHVCRTQRRDASHDEGFFQIQTVDRKERKTICCCDMVWHDAPHPTETYSEPCSCPIEPLRLLRLKQHAESGEWVLQC